MKRLILVMALVAVFATSAMAETASPQIKEGSAVVEVHGRGESSEHLTLGISDSEDSFAWLSAAYNLAIACESSEKGKSDPNEVSMRDSEQDVDKVAQYAVNNSRQKILKSMMEVLARNEHDPRYACLYSKIRASFETAKLLKK